MDIDTACTLIQPQYEIVKHFLNGKSISRRVAASGVVVSEIWIHGLTFEVRRYRI
jgi:hypothetical protein